MLAYEHFQRSRLAPVFGDSLREDAYQAWCSKGAPEDYDAEEVGAFLWRFSLELVELSNPIRTFETLDRLWRRFAARGHDVWTVRQHASDALVLGGDFAGARRVAMQPPIGTAARAWADRDLTLAYWSGGRVTGHHVVALAGPRLTAFGRANFELIAQQLEIQVRAFEQHAEADVLAAWASECRTHQFGLYSGCAWLTERECLYLSAHGPATKWAFARLRDAENVVREDIGLPHVGEGWIEETRLYYLLKQRFSSETVDQHASPDWLGRQHLDIYMPERRVAIEYHGLQHDRPVAHFGGERAFRQTVERDKRKARRCHEHGVQLVVVRPGYSLDDVISSILDHTRTDQA